MKKLLFVLLSGVLLISCEKERGEITSVELYYKGRTVLHSTFHVPLKFYSKDGLVLDMLLWSLDSTLENGRYTICPDKPSDSWGDKGHINKTFSRDACFWRGELIKDGYIDVQRDGDTYSFDINLTDAKGENHVAQYSGKVANKRSSEITPYLGFFDSLCLEKTSEVNQEHQSVDVYYMSLTTGDGQNVYYRQLWFYFTPKSLGSPEGYYNVESDNIDLEGTYVYRDVLTTQIIPIVSGTFKITRTNSYPPYRVDIDVMTKDGERIKGDYINGVYAEIEF